MSETNQETAEQLLQRFASYDSRLEEAVRAVGAGKEQLRHYLFVAAVAVVGMGAIAWSYTVVHGLIGGVLIGVAAFFLFGDEAQAAASKAGDDFVSAVLAAEAADATKVAPVIAALQVWLDFYQGPPTMRSIAVAAVQTASKNNAQWNELITQHAAAMRAQLGASS